MSGVRRRRGLITTERQETLKFRAVTVNTRGRVSLVHEDDMRRERCVTLWGLALMLGI